MTEPVASSRRRKRSSPANRSSTANDRRSSEAPFEAQLDRRALSYLNRYDASVVQLRRVLQRFARKADPGGEAGSAALIEALLSRYQSSGLLDDARYARTMAAGLRQRGVSKRGILAKLHGRGVGEVEAQAAIGTADAESSGDNPEIEAARRYARRRRLGPYRQETERQAKLQRDLAALARAGFSYEVARTIVGGDRPDEDTF